METIQFTESQQKALDLSYGKLVLAGAGSGKTTVMTERYVRMLENPKIEPHNIVALTFGRKAAANLKQKVHSALFERERSDFAKALFWRKQREKMAWSRITTVHSFCTKLLRSYPLEAGVDPDFRIVDNLQTDISLHVSSSISRMAYKYDADLKELMTFIPMRSDLEKVINLTLSNFRVKESVKEAIEDPKAAEVFLSDQYDKLIEVYDSGCGSSENDHKKFIEVIKQIGIVSQKIEKTLTKSRSQLCYDDLEQLSLNLLKTNSKVLNEVRKPIKSLMVDEFQDTSIIQWEIIKLLGSGADGSLDIKKVFFVGDEKQSIYSFRSADVTVVRKAEKEFEKVENRRDLWSVDLIDNFRSVPSIIEPLNRTFETVFAPEKVKYLEFEARPGSLESGRESFDPMNSTAELGLLLDGSEADISDIVAKRIKLAVEEIPLQVLDGGEMRKLRYGDIGILIRRWDRLKTIEEALIKADIPYQVAGGKGFFREQEIIDLLNLISALADSRDKIALAGLFRSPIFSLSDNTLALLFMSDKTPIDTFKDFIENGHEQSEILNSLSNEEVVALKNAWSLWQKIVRYSSNYSVSELLYKVLDLSGAWAVYSLGKNGEKKRTNIFQFIDIIENEASDGHSSLRELRDRLCLLRDSDSTDITSEFESDSENSVTIMTVFKSKGLEFSFVVLPDISSNFRFNRGINELQRGNLMVDESPYCGLTHTGLGIVESAGKSSGGTIHHLMKDLTSPAEAFAEIKRLLYVATTRARDHLLVLGNITNLKQYNIAISEGKIKNQIAMLSNALGFKISEDRVLQIDRETGFNINLLEKLEQEEKARTFQELKVDFETLPEDVSDPSILIYEKEMPDRWVIPITAFASYVAKPTDENLRQLVWYMNEEAENGNDSKLAEYSESIPGSGIEVGNAVHEIYQRFGPGCSWADSKNYAESLIEAVYGSSAEAEEVLRRVQTQINNSEEIDFHYDTEKIFKEIPLLLKIGDIQLRGRIDVVWRTGESVIAGDYKTNDLSGVDAKKFAASKGYDIQAKLYALALAKAWNLESVESELIFLSTKEKVHFKVDINDEKEYITHAATLIEHWNRLIKEKKVI